MEHLIDENEYQYGDDEWTNALSESNWIFQTNKHFMNYVIFTSQEMTLEQLKQNPTTVHPNQKLDSEEGESNKEEEQSTPSSDMSEQDSESDTTVDDTQDQEKSQTPEALQIHSVCNTTMHNEDDSTHD